MKYIKLVLIISTVLIIFEGVVFARESIQSINRNSKHENYSDDEICKYPTISKQKGIDKLLVPDVINNLFDYSFEESNALFISKNSKDSLNKGKNKDSNTYETPSLFCSCDKTF